MAPLLVVDRDALHAVAVTELGDVGAGVLGELVDARIVEQPRVAGDLHQHILEGEREADCFGSSRRCR